MFGALCSACSLCVRTACSTEHTRDTHAPRWRLHSPPAASLSDSRVLRLVLVVLVVVCGESILNRRPHLSTSIHGGHIYPGRRPHLSGIPSVTSIWHSIRDIYLAFHPCVCACVLACVRCMHARAIACTHMHACACMLCVCIRAMDVRLDDMAGLGRWEGAMCDGMGAMGSRDGTMGPP